MQINVGMAFRLVSNCCATP